MGTETLNSTSGAPAGFTPDYDREERCGFPEVIYAAGKTAEQTAAIAENILEHADCVLITRADAECGSSVRARLSDAIYLKRAHILFVDRRQGGITSGVAPSLLEGNDEDALLSALLEGGVGRCVVCCAGTSDLPVAEEAAITARIAGSAVTLITDVGIAGVHRVLAREETLRGAHAIAVAAGMEGALPSLVAGLVDVPVVAIPTSVGYGASFGGIAALLGMLNSCAGGVSVVNIDNGFGAGQIIDRINRPPARFHSTRSEREGA